MFQCSAHRDPHALSFRFHSFTIGLEVASGCLLERHKTHRIGRHRIEKYGPASASPESNFINLLASAEEVSIIGLGQKSCFSWPWAAIKGGQSSSQGVSTYIGTKASFVRTTMHLTLSHSLLMSLCLSLKMCVNKRGFAVLASWSVLNNQSFEGKAFTVFANVCSVNLPPWPISSYQCDTNKQKLEKIHTIASCGPLWAGANTLLCAVHFLNGYLVSASYSQVV